MGVYLREVVRGGVGSEKVGRVKVVLWGNMEEKEVGVMIVEMIWELMRFIKMVCY